MSFEVGVSLLALRDLMMISKRHKWNIHFQLPQTLENELPKIRGKKSIIHWYIEQKRSEEP